MEALANVPGLLTPKELVAMIIDRFGTKLPQFQLITVKDIIEPKSDFVVALYQEYLGLLKIDVAVTAAQLKQFECPEAFMDALPMRNVFAALRKFFARQNAGDFSMLDLTAPTFKRTYGGIAAMENYVYFCQMGKEELLPDILTIKERKDSFEAICEKKGSLTAEKIERASACTGRADRVTKLSLSLNDTKITIEKLASRVDKVIIEGTYLTKKLEEQKIQSNALRVSINQLEEELNLQRKMVVPDPGQIEKDTAHKKEKLMEVNGRITFLKENLEQLQKEIQQYEQIFEIKHRFEKYMDITSNLKSAWEKKQLVKIKKGSPEMQNIEGMQDEILKKKAFLQKLKENLSSEKANADSRLAKMMKTVRQLESDRANLDKKNLAEGKTCEKLRPVIKELQKQAQSWIEIKSQCEAYVQEKKNELDKNMKKEVAEIDKELLLVNEAAVALKAKVDKELAEATKLLNEQKAKDAAEGRTYNPK